MEQQDTTTTVKKSPFDDLSREELVTKCKGLLVIAQKAKQNKQELQNEVESYKLQLEKCESEKKQTEESYKTLQELVDSLTEQKLNIITEVDTAQSKIKALNIQCKNYELEINKLKADLIIKDQNITDISLKLSDFDSEVTSLKRQNNRLVEENEQLINQLTEIEEKTAEFNNIGLQQREQLKILEENVQSGNEELNIKIQELNQKVKELEATSEDLVKNKENYENKIKELTEQCESEKTKKEKLNVKLRSYKDKILKCAACINQLKNSRFILTKTVKEYSENIPKWRNDIIRASKVLDEQISNLNNENSALKDKVQALEKQLEKMHSKNIKNYNSSENTLRDDLKVLETYKVTIQDLQKQNLHLQDELNAIKQANQLLSDVELPAQINENKSLKDQIKEKIKNNEALSQANVEILKTIDELKSDNQKLTEALNMNAQSRDTIEILNSENLSLKEKIQTLEKLLEEIKSHQIIDKEHKDSAMLELNNQQQQLDSLKVKIEELQQQKKETLNQNIMLQDHINTLTLANQKLKDVELPSLINENKLLKEENNKHIENIAALRHSNDELKKKIDQLEFDKQKLQDLLQTKLGSGDTIETLNFQIKALESEKDTLVKEKFNARDSIIELENSNKILTDQNAKLNLDIQVIKQDLERVLQEHKTSKKDQENESEGEINLLKCKIMEQQEQLERLKKEFDDTQDLNNLLKEEVETLKLSLEQPKDDTENLSDLNVSLQADIVKLETKLAAYKQENASLLSEIKESRMKTKEFDKLASEYEENKSQLFNYKSENSELLSEMKEINQVLKERWECMSKQKKAIEEMENLIETLEKDRNNLKEENKGLLKKVEALEKDLMNSEKMTRDNSEVLNQITMERDNAVTQLSESEALVAALREELEKTKQHTAPVDLPNDDMSTSTISKAEEVSRMKDLDETFEDKYTKLRIFALKLKKKLNETLTLLQNTEQDKAKLEKMLKENEAKSSTLDTTVNKVDDNSTVAELHEQMKSLTTAAEATKKITQELEKVKADLNARNQELASEIEAHKATKENLEKARRDVKKKSVLSLEMEDYERSLKELTHKMEENKKKMVQMESTIDTQEGTITAMKTQIKLLEEQIKSEETQNRLTKEELQRSIEDGRDKDNLIQTKNAIISKLEQDLENEKRKNEEADLEMTTLISEKEKVIMTLGEDKADLNNKMKRLEFKCSELNEKLKITNMELADLKTEYTSYKVRAQAVLRQNQTVDHSQEEQLKEEAAALRAQIQTLTSKINAVQEQVTEQSTEAENSRRRASEASAEAARAQQRTARLQADLTKISQQLESERTQHKLQVSTLTQCYKSQISELEAKLAKETESLKKQIALLQESAKSGKMGDANQNQYMVPIIPKDDSDGEMDINVSMIPREEGEGSESAPTPPPSKPYVTGSGSNRSPVPLEKLLEEGVPEDEAFDSSSLDLTSDQEIADLKRRLSAQQMRVKHVTVLLSESERECARLTQLSDLLKAELRRVRGTTNNAHNAEYMKNVTLKFLTLPAGDERSRLVPVLQKILTLTPEETQTVNAVAKGLVPNPSKGWGSYLPWPGGSK